MGDDRNSPAIRFPWRGLIAVLLVCAFLAGLNAIHLRSRTHCSAFSLFSSGFMRGTQGFIQEYHERGEELPPSLILVFPYFGATPGARTPWTYEDCSPQRPEEVSIGAYTLEDWLDGRVTREELRASAAQSPQAGAWRTMGHYYFCVDPQTLSRGLENDITGFETLLPESVRVPLFNVLFADGRVMRCVADDLPALAEAHDGPPLPDSFFALFDNKTR